MDRGKTEEYEWLDRNNYETLTNMQKMFKNM